MGAKSTAGKCRAPSCPIWISALTLPCLWTELTGWELLHSLQMTLFLVKLPLRGWADAAQLSIGTRDFLISQSLVNLFTIAAVERTWYIVVKEQEMDCDRKRVFFILKITESFCSSPSWRAPGKLWYRELKPPQTVDIVYWSISFL